MKPLALISPVLSMNSTLNNLPSPLALLYVLMADLFVTLALIDHLQFKPMLKHEAIRNKIKKIQAYLFWYGFKLEMPNILNPLNMPGCSSLPALFEAASLPLF